MNEPLTERVAITAHPRAYVYEYSHAASGCRTGGCAVAFSDGTELGDHRQSRRGIRP